MNRLYLYAITLPEHVASPGPIEGLEPGSRVFAIEGAGLAAIASEVPAEVFSEEGLPDRLADLEWISGRGMAHERVVETCFAAGPTIPLRFGTVLRDERSVRILLEQHGTRLRAILEELAGLAEFGLRVRVDRARFEAWLAARGPAAPRSSDLPGTGRAYLEGKRATALARRAATGELGRALAETCSVHESAAVRSVRRDVQVEGPLALEATFLVRLEEEEAFLRASREEAGRRAEQGLELVLTGPWPPYSFVPPLEEDRS